MSIGILITVVMVIGYVLAQSPPQGHPPSEISPGSFQAGAYIFPGDLEVSGTTDLNGNVELPTSGISGAGAGSGLNADQLDGESKDYFQRRVTGTCSSGSSIRKISESGHVTCEADDGEGGGGGAFGCIDYFTVSPPKHPIHGFPSCDGACSANELAITGSVCVRGKCLASRDIGAGDSNCDGSTIGTPYVFSARHCVCCHHESMIGTCS